MTVPSSGITADVIREMMPPYRLSDDLLGATLAALPPPPADAPMTWRRAHLTRLVEEISTLMPANAAQARIAAQVLIFRELAETIAARAYAPELTVAHADPAVPAMLRSAGREETVVPVRPGRSAGSAADPGLPGGSTPEEVVTRLDKGPGWTLDVVRARTGVSAEVGEAPGR